MNISPCSKCYPKLQQHKIFSSFVELKCVCVCVFIFFHRKGFSWLDKTKNVMLEIRSAMVCWGNISASKSFVAMPQTIILITKECLCNFVKSVLTQVLTLQLRRYVDLRVTAAMLIWALFVDALGWKFLVNKSPHHDKVSFTEGESLSKTIHMLAAFR